MFSIPDDRLLHSQCQNAEHSDFGDSSTDFKRRVRLCIARAAQGPFEHVRIVHATPAGSLALGRATWIPFQHFRVDSRFCLRDLLDFRMIAPTSFITRRKRFGRSCQRRQATSRRWRDASRREMLQAMKMRPKGWPMHKKKGVHPAGVGVNL